MISGMGSKNALHIYNFKKRVLDQISSEEFIELINTAYINDMNLFSDEEFKALIKKYIAKFNSTVLLTLICTNLNFTDPSILELKDLKKKLLFDVIKDQDISQKTQYIILQTFLKSSDIMNEIDQVLK